MSTAKTAHLIPARVWADDNGAKAAFDAAPWFAQAEPAEIAALARIGWRGNYEADTVAQWFADTLPAVRAVFDHSEEQTEAGEECGFECAVDETAARAWLAANRPDVLALIEGEETATP